MAETVVSKAPAGYWVVAVLALVWMAIGVFAWTMDLRMGPEQLAVMSKAQRSLYETRPQWVFIVYGVAVFSGLIGAIGLLARRAWAIGAFWLSLIAVLVQFGYTFIAMDAMARLGPALALPLPLAIIAIDIALVWFSTFARRRGWIG